MEYDSTNKWGIFDSKALINYFRKSDQILTYADLITNLAKNGKDVSSFGCLFQKMPGCSEEYLGNIFQGVLESPEWTQIKSSKLSNLLLFFKKNLFLEYNYENIKAIFKHLNVENVEFQVL